MREMQPGDCFRSGKEERGESRLFKCLSFDTFQFAWGLRARSFLRESLFPFPDTHLDGLGPFTWYHDLDRGGVEYGLPGRRIEACV